MFASTLRRTALRAFAALALATPTALALLATTCSATPPAASASSPPPPPTPAEPTATSGSWTVPAVPLAHRTVILLQPPVTGPDASAILPIAADPAPLVEQGQWIYDLRYDRGDLYLAGVHPTRLATPRETPRVMGRFALELYSGPTLIERVRFDFPGLGAVDTRTVSPGGARSLHGSQVSFTAKLQTRVGVMLPATTRGTRLDLWDRATNRRWPLPWPAVEMTSPSTEDADHDAGSSDAATSDH